MDIMSFCIEKCQSIMDSRGEENGERSISFVDTHKRKEQEAYRRP